MDEDNLCARLASTMSPEEFADFSLWTARVVAETLGPACAAAQALRIYGEHETRGISSVVVLADNPRRWLVKHRETQVRH